MELPVAQAFVQFLIQKETDGFGPCAMKVLDICLGDFGAPTKKPVRIYSSNTIELVPTGGSAIGREQHHPPVCALGSPCVRNYDGEGRLRVVGADKAVCVGGMFQGMSRGACFGRMFHWRRTSSTV